MKKAELGSLLVQRAREAARDAHTAGASYLVVRPEDLGRVPAGEPASIWQLDDTFSLVADTDAITGALHQCQWPDVVGRILHPGWPKFNALGHYFGPLPRDCGHGGHPPLIGQDSEGGFTTAPSAAYPPPMCEDIARLLFEDFLLRGSSSSRAVTLADGGWA